MTALSCLALLAAKQGKGKALETCQVMLHLVETLRLTFNGDEEAGNALNLLKGKLDLAHTEIKDGNAAAIAGWDEIGDRLLLKPGRRVVVTDPRTRMYRNFEALSNLDIDPDNTGRLLGSLLDVTREEIRVSLDKAPGAIWAFPHSSVEILPEGTKL